MRNLTLLKQPLVVTQDRNRNIVRADILIEGEKIKQISPQITPSAETAVFKADNYVVTPAFVNSHFHFGETLFRGNAEGLALEQYIALTDKKLTESQQEAVIKFSELELIKNGISTACSARSWEPLSDSDLELYLPYPLMMSNKLGGLLKDFPEKAQEIREKHTQKNIHHGFWIHSLSQVDKNILQRLSKELEKHPELILTIHLAETEEQYADEINQFNKLPVHVLDHYGLLDNRMNLVHCNYLSELELGLIREKNTNITVCPTSNLKLSSGLPPLKKIFSRGINTSIASDGLATNNSANLLEAAKITGLMYGFPAQTLFDMVTLNPAKALGCSASIEQDSLANLNFYNLSESELHPVKNFLTNLIFAYTRGPEHMMVRGKFILENYKPKTDLQKRISGFEKVFQEVNDE